MTNFEDFKDKLEVKQFVELMEHNCIQCPVNYCKFSTNFLKTGGSCRAVLTDWCTRDKGDIETNGNY